MSIFIFSKPIHSGKTTELLSWCNRQKNIAGILMPDIDGQRNIHNIQTKENFIIQCDNPANAKETLVNIGRYHFYATAFEEANSILLQAASIEQDWLVIDEVGKLEMEEKGFYPAVQEIINTKKYKNLLLVVRDSLCGQVISFFKISNANIIHGLNELDLQ
jgi:nucleoside-triphosphatase THEP1